MKCRYFEICLIFYDLPCILLRLIYLNTSFIGIWLKTAEPRNKNGKIVESIPTWAFDLNTHPWKHTHSHRDTHTHTHTHTNSSKCVLPWVVLLIIQDTKTKKTTPRKKFILWSSEQQNFNKISSSLRATIPSKLVWLLLPSSQTELLHEINNWAFIPIGQ